jgi:hypothetical protein
MENKTSKEKQISAEPSQMIDYLIGSEEEYSEPEINPKLELLKSDEDIEDFMKKKKERDSKLLVKKDNSSYNKEDKKVVDHYSPDSDEDEQEQLRLKYEEDEDQYRNFSANDYYGGPTSDRLIERLDDIDSEINSYVSKFKHIDNKIREVETDFIRKIDDFKEETDEKITNVNSIIEENLRLRKVERRVEKQKKQRIGTIDFFSNIQKRLINIEKYILFKDSKYKCDKCSRTLKTDKMYFINCCTKLVVCENCSKSFTKKMGTCEFCETICKCLIHVGCN